VLVQMAQLVRCLTSNAPVGCRDRVVRNQDRARNIFSGLTFRNQFRKGECSTLGLLHLYSNVLNFGVYVRLQANHLKHCVRAFFGSVHDTPMCRGYSVVLRCHRSRPMHPPVNELEQSMQCTFLAVIFYSSIQEPGLSSARFTAQ
jgi:hypothetical protein